MATTSKNRRKPYQREQEPRRRDNSGLMIAVLAALPPILLAIAKLLETGHALSWW